MNPVVHFEMPYEDRDRAATFYTTCFGWKPQMLGEDMGSYVVMQTAETDEQGMITKPGNINGGMFKKSPENGFTSIVIAVNDINEAMKKVEAAGGKVTTLQDGKPMDIPGVGMYAGCMDTEGNRFSILQPKGM